MYILSILLAKYTEVKVSMKSRKTIAYTKLTATKVWLLIQCLKILHALKVLPNTTRI